MNAQIGWIGLGIMGYPMASNLLQAGFSLMAYDVNPQALARICEKGAAAAKLEEMEVGVMLLLLFCRMAA